MKVKYIILSMGVVALSLKGSLAAEGGPSQVFKCNFSYQLDKYLINSEEVLEVGKDVKIRSSTTRIAIPQSGPNSNQQVPGTEIEYKTIPENQKTELTKGNDAAEGHAYDQVTAQEEWITFRLATKARVDPDAGIKVKNNTSTPDGKQQSVTKVMKYEEIKQAALPGSLEDVSAEMKGEAQIREGKLYLQKVSISAPNQPTLQLPNTICSSQ